MCHALIAQAILSNIKLIPTSLIDSLASSTDRKGLIFSPYSLLLVKLLSSLHIPGSIEWEKDLGELEEETWQAMLEQVLLVSLSPTHLHNIYLN